MKRKIAVAMAITAGLCFAGSGQLKPAFAGHWQEVPNPYLDQYGWPPPQNDPNYQNYLDERALRVNGLVNWTGVYNGQSFSNSLNWPEDQDPYLSSCGFMPAGLSNRTDPGTSGSLSSAGKLRIPFHWVRDQINGQDDPNDNPPSTLHIQVRMEANAMQWDFAGNVNNTDVDVSVGIENGQQFSGTYIPPGQYPIYTSYVNKTIPVSIPTNGQDDVWSPWFTFDGSVQADISSNSSGSYEEEQHIDYTFGYQFDDRAAIISSSAEPTYYKDENGERQPNQRAENGSMTADVAATWNEALNMWYWNGSFDSNLIGSPWDSPTYTWAGSLLAGKPNPGNVSSISNDQYILDSYTEEAGPGDPLSLAVSAEDTDGRYLVGTYTINFHKPHENETSGPVSYTDAGDSPYQPFSLTLDSVSVTNRGLLEYGQDTDRRDMKWANGLSLGSATLGVNGAILAVIPGTQPVGVALGAISVVMGGAATVVSSLPAAPAVYVPLNVTSYAKYKEAVTNASNDVTYPSGIKYYATEREGTDRDTFFANLINAFVSDENGIGDPYYSAYTKVTGEAFFKPSKRTWTYDEYGANGFSGQKSVVAYRNGENPAVEITWREDP